MVLESFDMLSIIMLILIIIPFISYFINGTSLKIKHDKYVSFEILSNDSPALINSFFSGGLIKKVGEINVNSFYITLLDLINRKYVSVKLVSKGKKSKIDKHSGLNIFNRNKFDLGHGKELDTIILKVNKNHLDKLHPFEKNVLHCLFALENKGTIDIFNHNNVLKKRLKVNTFQKNYDAWMKNFYTESFKDNPITFFNNKFKRILQVYGLFLVAIFFFTAIFSYLNSAYFNLILSFIVGILGFYLTLYPSNFGGWTKEARELKTQWQSFKKYYNRNIKNKNINNSKYSQEFLDEAIEYIPYLIALGIPKSSLVKTFSQSNNVTDTYLFLKYSSYAMIKNIITDFLAADGSFDPKYYNTSGNFVPGYGL